MSDRLVTQALCWRVERRDGVMLALTDHDRDLTVEGVCYRAAPGMTPSAIVRGEGLDADTMAVTGALGTGAFRRDDLLAGRWDGARVVMGAVDWSDPAAGAVPLGEGRIGAVELDEHGFTAELRGVQAQLERPVSEATSPACRATLGDARCRVAMAPRRRFARVVACAGASVTLDAVEPVAGAYAEGVLRWFGGANTGLASAIEQSAGAVLTLRAVPAFAVAAGVLVEVTEGCDRRLATCAARFGNVANFRGEAGSTAAPAIVGHLATDMAAGTAWLVERSATIDVVLAQEALTLMSIDDAALDRGGNLALLGEELIQFRDAAQIAPRRWRLSTLLRGRRGSVAQAHAAGAAFALVERGCVATIALPRARPGDTIRVLASGTGDPQPVAVSVATTGASLAPPAPVRLRATRRGDGDLDVRWVRRSRLGWRWGDDGDAPLGEERERYRVTIGEGAAARAIESDVPAVIVPAALVPAGAVRVAVRQLGTLAASATATGLIEGE